MSEAAKGDTPHTFFGEDFEAGILTPTPHWISSWAVDMYVAGGNLHRIGRHLKVSPQTISLWVTDRAEALPRCRSPPKLKMPIWTKSSRSSVIKNRIYILTVIDRKTRCILGRAVVWVRTQVAIQQVVHLVPKAKCY